MQQLLCKVYVAKLLLIKIHNVVMKHHVIFKYWCDTFMRNVKACYINAQIQYELQLYL